MTGAATRAVQRQPRSRRERSPNETRARLLAWSMVLAPLVALVIFGVMIAGERSRDQVAGDPSSAPGPTVRAQFAGAVSFDPEPAGDGEEHPAEVANAIDGDRETTWETEGYDTREFNSAKPGVGLVLQLREPADVRDVSIATELPGWIVEVRTAEQPSTTLDGWTRVSERTPVEDNKKIPVDLDGAKTRHLLLWITRLSIDPEDTNRSRARLSDITVWAADPGSASDTRG